MEAKNPNTLFDKVFPVRPANETGESPKSTPSVQAVQDVSTTELANSIEEDNLPLIRVKSEAQGEKVKKFATAQGASLHLKVDKAKRFGLKALHKAVGWMAKKK